MGTLNVCHLDDFALVIPTKFLWFIVGKKLPFNFSKFSVSITLYNVSVAL